MQQNKKKYVIDDMQELKALQRIHTKEQFFDKFEISFRISKKLIAHDMIVDLREFDKIMTAEEFKNLNVY